jgi:Kef-type K+ transport system membrane component KefB
MPSYGGLKERSGHQVTREMVDSMTVLDNTAKNSSNRKATRGRPAIVGATMVAALALWALLSQVAGVDLEAKQGGPTMHIGGVSVFVASAVVSLAGWGLLALLERRTANARKIWTIVALIACALSLGSPLTSGVGAGAKLGLASLHLVVGAVLIPGLRRSAS